MPLLFWQVHLRFSRRATKDELMPAHEHPHAHVAPAPAPAFDATTDPAEFWEHRYASSDRIWSGKPNATLVDAVAGLPVGRALDLGCGEGGDAIWLAQQGWQVTAVDISPSAIDRGASAARGLGIPDDRIRFLVADLADWRPTERYELVTASFLQSPVALARADGIARAAEAVEPGGRLLTITHGSPPSWASSHDVAGHRFLTPAEELAELAFDEAAWSVELAETWQRAITAPDGSPATLDDNVILLRRL